MSRMHVKNRPGFCTCCHRAVPVRAGFAEDLYPPMVFAWLCVDCLPGAHEDGEP